MVDDQEYEPDPELIIRQYEVLVAQVKTIQYLLNQNRPLEALKVCDEATEEAEDSIESFKDHLDSGGE